MNDFTIDSSEVMKMFSEFDSKRRKQVYRKAVRKALSIVRKLALLNLKGAVNPSTINRKDKWGNSFRKGVTIKVYKDAQSGAVHIMKNFKLKFFELGTTERYTKTWKGLSLKKKRRTGKILATRFFTNAKRQTEQQVFSSIDELLSESIRKINNKYK